MSWEEPIVGGGMSTYYPKEQGFAYSSAEAVGLWLIDQLREKYPTHRTIRGELPINYTWFFDLSPEDVAESLDLPAVAIGVMTAEHPRLGSYIQSKFGEWVPGEVIDGLVLTVILGNNVQLRDGIEHRLSRMLLRIVNLTSGTPFQYGMKYDHGDDRGFSSIDRFVISSLWQNLTDEAFVKVSSFEVGWVEDFVDPSDQFWNAVAGNLGYGTGDTPPGGRSMKISITMVDGTAQRSKMSYARVSVPNAIELSSNAQIS